MKTNGKKIEAESVYSPELTRIVREVVGCKWTLNILALIRAGVVRPGAIERRVEGLSTKVMNECLRMLVGYNIVERVAYPEVPPRVEYRLTEFGQQFNRILDAIAELDRTLSVELKARQS